MKTLKVKISETNCLPRQEIFWMKHLGPDGDDVDYEPSDRQG